MSTQDTIRGYTKAWTSGDMKATRRFLADDVDFQGSMETHKTADGFMGGLTMFREGLFADHTVLHELIDGNNGFLLYDCALKTGATLRCAEYFETAGDKITRIRLVFDTANIPKP